VSACDITFVCINDNSLCDEADTTDNLLALSVLKQEVVICMPLVVGTDEMQLTVATELTYPVAVEATGWAAEDETEPDNEERDIIALLDTLEGSCGTKLLVVNGTPG